MPEAKPPDDLKEFMLVLRRALYLIIRYIEKKYPDCVGGQQ